MIPREVEAAVGSAPVSVAIATFNRAALLRQALTSCLQQRVPPQRVIVVDDGSTDDTAQVVESFKGLPIDYVNAGRVGLGHARNLATALCKTPFLCILDDDDLMLPNRIADHMAGFADGAHMSHGGWINFTHRHELDFHPGKPVNEDVIVYIGNAITHGACCYDTTVLREFPYRTDIVGGIDFDMAVRAVRSGIRCRHTSSYVLLRRRHDASMSALAGSGQTATRQSVVEALNRWRGDEEIAARTAAGRSVGEIAILDVPSLPAIREMIGGEQLPMRVAAFLNRMAQPFFDVLAGLGHCASNVELFDIQHSLSGNVAVAFPPTEDGDSLSRVDRALRTVGLKPMLMIPDAPLFVQPLAGFGFKTDAGCFRIALQSESLKELQLIHRILRVQRSWEWYVVARTLEMDTPHPIYALISAQFRNDEANGKTGGVVSELAHFITQETDVFPVFLSGPVPK